MVKEIKQGAANAKQFTTQLLHFVAAIVALSPIVAGIYTIISSRAHASVSITSIATIFSGAMASVCGGIILYKVLMRKAV